MVTGISNNQGFCGSLTRYVVGAGLAMLAYLAGGPALAAIGSVGYLWMTSSNSRGALESVEKVAVRDYEVMTAPAILEGVETDHEQVIRLASSLIPQGMTLGNRSDLIETVTRLLVSEREQVIRLASSLFTQDMNIWDRCDLIEAVANVPVNDREQVIRLASSLTTQGMSALERGGLIETIVRLLVSDRDQVIQLASSLITQDMNFWDRCDLIEAVAKIPVGDREQIKQLALPLITQDMTVEGKCHLIRALAAVPLGDREQVIRLVSRFIDQHLVPPDHHAKANLIEGLSSMPEIEREQFTHYALLLTQDIPRDHFAATELIIRALWNAGPDERAERAQRALDQIPQDLLNGLENEEIPQRMVTILETPLDRQIPALRAQMNELFEAGHDAVDVHHDGRDARTRNSVELLQKRQGQLSDDLISNRVKEFKQFLSAFGDKELGDKARQALEGQDPQEEEKEDWPPLLKNNEPHAIDGLHISGEELIARLWLYANDAQHPENEKMNCKTSMIEALANSIDFKGNRVCPPGQTQRLVVGVLQGRLEGANVDIVETPTLTLDQSVAAFLYANQTCSSRAQLMANAEVFLNTNPNPSFTRDAFLEKIRDFATSMGLE